MWVDIYLPDRRLGLFLSSSGSRNSDLSNHSRSFLTIINYRQTATSTVEILVKQISCLRNWPIDFVYRQSHRRFVVNLTRMRILVSVQTPVNCIYNDKMISKWKQIVKGKYYLTFGCSNHIIGINTEGKSLPSCELMREIIGEVWRRYYDKQGNNWRQLVG